MPTQEEPRSEKVPPSLFTPENCVSSSRIRAFLRLSRIATDDTIRQHLNEVNDCDEYFRSKIVPQWQARAEIVAYCEAYAGKLRASTQRGQTVELGVYEFDLRTDPYALRTHQQKLAEQYSQCDTIDNWIHNEQTVEEIIKKQTQKVLNDKCYYKDWINEFNEARR